MVAPPTCTWVVIEVRRLRDQKLGPWLVQSVASLAQFRSIGTSGQYSGLDLVNWESEQVFPEGVPEMQRADAILAAVYKKAAAPERYRASFYDGPHKFDRQMQKEAFDWFDRWLKS